MTHMPLEDRGNSRPRLRPICLAVAVALTGMVVPVSGDNPAGNPIAFADSGVGSASVVRLREQAGAGLSRSSGHRQQRGLWPVVEVENCNDAGPGSLRAVIEGLGESTRVDLTGLTCSVITLTSGAVMLPDLGSGGGDGVEIVGPGRAQLTISAGGNSQVFTTDGKYNRLVVSGVTVTGGHASGEGATGGCISLASGNVHLEDMRIHDCHVTGTELAVGGAVHAAVITAEYSQIDGNSVSGNGVVRGGALSAKYGAGSLASTITGNSAVTSGTSEGFASLPLGGETIESGGGAIAAKYFVAVIDSLVSGNTADALAGDIHGGGVLGPGGYLVRSRLVGNTVTTASGLAMGGGMKSAALPQEPKSAPRILSGLAARQVQPGSMSAALSGWIPAGLRPAGEPMNALYVFDSEFSGNRADNGGAVHFNGGWAGEPMALRIVNSTLSGNSAGTGPGQGGGGVALGSGNFVMSGGTVAFNAGGGLWVDTHPAVTPDWQLSSSIVADNVGDDVRSSLGATFTGSHNLVGTWDETMVSLPGDTLTGDPMLRPLALNGGWLTRTHAPHRESPVLEAAAKYLQEFDQRGPPFLRTAWDAGDIGAYEYNDIIFANGFENRFGTMILHGLTLP